MMTSTQSGKQTGRIVMAAAVFFCVLISNSTAQRPQAPAPQHHPVTRPAVRPEGGRPTFRQSESQTRQSGYAQRRSGEGYPATMRPAYPGPPYMGPGFSRPPVRGYAPPAETPPGHLGDWLNQHRNLSVQEQERVLRSDPNFHRLAPPDQQRVIQQLHQVNQLNPEQQQRRAARVEMLERLSPQERMQINISRSRWMALPPDRQAAMKNAFRDLRAVPPDQRQTVLNSARYQGAFSPDERGVLTDMLRAEPYQPAQ